MSIKAVIFDLGGVIVRTEDPGPRTRLAQSLGMTYTQLDQFVFHGGPDGSSARATVGQISEEDHWRNVLQALNLPESEMPRMRREFFGGDQVDRDLVALIRSLKPRYKTGLISNAWDGLRAYIEREHFEDAFDHMVISAEVGMAKPVHDIYHYALSKLGVTAEESVFLDDFSENVKAARKVGMQVIHFMDPNKGISQLKHLLETQG
jgi:epoxide hydrolase-like predicted phosphatase